MSSLRFTDPSKIRGRSQLQGTQTRDGNVAHISGPRVPRWAWDSSQNGLLQTLELDVYNASLGVYDRMHAKRIELERAGKLTPSGIAEEMAKVAQRGAADIETAKSSLA